MTDRTQSKPRGRPATTLPDFIRLGAVAVLAVRDYDNSGYLAEGDPSWRPTLWETYRYAVALKQAGLKVRLDGLHISFIREERIAFVVATVPEHPIMKSLGRMCRGAAKKLRKAWPEPPGCTCKEGSERCSWCRDNDIHFDATAEAPAVEQGERLRFRALDFSAGCARLLPDAVDVAGGSVERLDYSKPPPPGYVVRLGSGAWDGWGFEVDGAFIIPTSGGLETREYLPALAAWTHYKARHDPPGLRVWDEEGDWLVQVLDCPAVESPQNQVGPGLFYSLEDDARAAAWAWYDRRLAATAKIGYAVAERVLYGDREVWPAALTWSDEQVAAIERWLLDSTAELPEVLRGG